MMIFSMILKLQCHDVDQKRFHVGQEVRDILFPSHHSLIISSFLESQLQLAFINQIYFHGHDAEQIFGSVRVDQAHQMVQTIEIDNPECFQGYPRFFLRISSNYLTVCIF